MTGTGGSSNRFLRHRAPETANRWAVWRKGCRAVALRLQGICKAGGNIGNGRCFGGTRASHKSAGRLPCICLAVAGQDRWPFQKPRLMGRWGMGAPLHGGAGRDEHGQQPGQYGPTSAIEAPGERKGAEVRRKASNGPSTSPGGSEGQRRRLRLRLPPDSHGAVPRAAADALRTRAVQHDGIAARPPRSFHCTEPLERSSDRPGGSVERPWRSPFTLQSLYGNARVGTSGTFIPRGEGLERLDISRVKELRASNGPISSLLPDTYKERPFLMSRGCVPDVPSLAFLKSRESVPDVPSRCS